MTRKNIVHSWQPVGVAAILIALAIARAAAAEASPEASSAYDSYVSKVEGNLAKDHQSASSYLAPTDWVKVRQGELQVEELTPEGGQDIGGGLLHDWRGTAFVRGATEADIERLMKDYSAYPRHYAPEVIRAHILSRQNDRYQVQMRVRQQHILTIVMDTAYDVDFARSGVGRGYSISRSTRIAEIDQPGAARERALGPKEEHGFLWRLNTYWSYEEQDGGLYMQIETVSLSRSIPTGLGWAIGPFIESVPRESLEFTLRSTRDALHR